MIIFSVAAFFIFSNFRDVVLVDVIHNLTFSLEREKKNLNLG